MTATALGLAAGAVTPAAHAAPDDKAPAGSNWADLIVYDMTHKNAHVLGPHGANYGPVNIMGNKPRGDNTPSWWHNNLVNPGIYHNSNWWNAIIPWVLVQSADNNPATNTRVRLSQIRLHLLSKSGKWHTAQTATLSGQQYTEGGTAPGPNNTGIARSGPGNSIEVKPPQVRSHGNYHGWGTLMNFTAAGLQPWDIKAVHACVDSKLVVDNPNRPDDRKHAKYIIHVGADYYPSTSSLAGQDPGLNLRDGNGGVVSWLPGIGNSRNRQINMYWVTHNFATLEKLNWSGLPAQEPGGGITVDELRKNPPPLNY